MPGEGYIDGYSGQEIILMFEGVRIASVQNLNWRANQSKTPLRGAGYEKAHGMGRGVPEYELDFEIKELNSAVLSRMVPEGQQTEITLMSFEIKGVEYNNILDLKNCKLFILYPAKNNKKKKREFLGFEFTEVSGSYSLDDDSITVSCSGVALDAKGIV